MEETRKYTKNNVIIAFLIGIIIGLGGYYLYDNRDAIKNIKNRNGDDNSGRAYLDDGALSDGEIYRTDEETYNTIEVKDQPAGYGVIVDYVSFENTGWVTIHEDREGELGNILGAHRFEKGIYNDEEVELLRNTVEGGIYYAVIYSDDGDREFDYKKDVPMVNAAGDMIMAEFRVIRIR